ncbi:hypothetical protein BY458DRAFT_589109 [Sporodiniella umbellata]|nr:hypothetical protein BY458DRAFT_589109 [Sporodiniella umbellata]
MDDLDSSYGEHVHSWEEIKQRVAKGQVHLLKRNRRDEKVYREWIQKTLAVYGSIESYMIQERVKFPADQDYLILPNDFPYSVTPGIRHLLIWSRKPLEKPWVESLLAANFQGWETTFFVNPPELQSIRRLPHVHVFMRKEDC